MKPKKKVEDAIRKKLRFTVAATLRDRWLTDVMNAQEEDKGITPALHEPLIGRTIMRSRIVKLTSVAAVLAVAVLALVFCGRLGTPAYALDQTVDALQNVRFLHLVARHEGGQITDERWVEIGMDGLQLRYRQQHPRSLLVKFQQTGAIPLDTGTAAGDLTMVPMAIEDGESTALYRYDKQAVILYDRKDRQFQWVGDLGGALENLRQKGKILEENVDYGGRPAHKVWWPALSSECYVDPQTKLPIAVGKAQLSYEEPPAGTFDIVIPDGYAVLDKRPGAPASPTPAWLLEADNTVQNKQECFLKGTRALAQGNYTEAAAQLEQAVGVDSWAWFWLGRAYYELGQYDRAIQNFNTLFDAFRKAGGETTLPYCNYARGLAYARSGNLEAAKADFETCLPTMIRTLRIPSGGFLFEYADNPMVRSGKYKPTDSEMVVKMINRLRIISGQSFGYDPSATPAQNEAAVGAWEQWFKNGGQIKFTPDAKLLPVPPAVQP